MFQIKFFLTVFFNIILFISPALKHEYYVSSTDVVYIQETSQIQITSRLFIDDVEAFFNTNSSDNIQLQPDIDILKIDSLSKAFFNTNFKIQADNNNLKIRYLGRKYEEDQIHLYAEVFIDNTPKVFEIKNTFLIPFREGQKNIIHFTSNGFKKSHLLDSSKLTLTQLLKQ